MIVRIKSKYALRDEDVPLLSGMENKLKWWMKSEDSDGTFMRFEEVQLANNILDVEVDLTPGRYSAGCGDWNVENNLGRKVYQRLYFYLTPDGDVIYVDRKADLPSYEDVMSMNELGGAPPTSYKSNVGTSIDQFEKQVSESYLRVLEHLNYCNFPYERESDETEAEHEYAMITKDEDNLCPDFDAILEGEGFRCTNCIYGTKLYVVK